MRFYLRIFAYFRRDVAVIVALVALIWAALGLGLLAPVPLKAVTDHVLVPTQGGAVNDAKTRFLLGLVPADTFDRIVGLAAVCIGVMVVLEFVNFGRNILNKRLEYNGTARVRQVLFDKFQSLSADYHKSKPQGDAIYRLSTDALGPFGVLDTFIGAANSVLTLVVIGGVMLWTNVTITVVSLALGLLLVVANVYFSRTIRTTSLRSKHVDAEMTTFMQRALGLVGLTQLFNRQPYESQRFRGAVRRSVRAGMTMNWHVLLYPAVKQSLFAMGYGFILGYGGYLVWRDRAMGERNPFTIGDIVTLTVYLGQLWEPLRRLAGFTADVQQNAAACRRVFEVLDLKPLVQDAPNAAALPVAPRTVTLKKVGFRYPQGNPILLGMNATVRPGEMVAFIGPSGTGKSTLLNLLPRLYDPTSGAIELDGHDLRTVRTADVRRHVAVVPQECPIFAGTVAENIAYGRPDATPEQIEEAAKMAGADEFIREMCNGYDSEIVECGQNLSGGQRQRLAIARALLTEAPILILDEPTSALDPKHERQVMEVLERLKGTRTIILVTHRLETAQACDRIFVLGGGLVVEQGTHEQLLARRGAYFRMTEGEHESAASKNGNGHALANAVATTTTKPAAKAFEAAPRTGLFAAPGADHDGPTLVVTPTTTALAKRVP